MKSFEIPDEIKEEIKDTIAKAKENRQAFFDSIRNEIAILVNSVNDFDKVYLLGGLGARLLKSVRTPYNQFLERYNGEDKAEVKNDLRQDDENIEVFLEYVMSIATATSNAKRNVIPTKEDIDSIYQQLLIIKRDILFYELSSDIPVQGNEFDQWLKIGTTLQTLSVRGEGYHVHIDEIFKEVFQPHNSFLESYYGFNANDVYETIMKLDELVYSKINNPLGAMVNHKRFCEWMEEKGEKDIITETQRTGKDFIRQYIESNPDLGDEVAPDKVVLCDLDSINSYDRMFWVIPQTDKERKLFEILSVEFGHNSIFFEPPKFKAFPLNDTLIKLKPLIKEEGKYYYFSVQLAFRNIFKIVEDLIKAADAVYYDNYFRGNSRPSTKDNYIERKAKQLFEKLLPSATFYHSVKYNIVENDQLKNPELDILGVSADTIYIIEVKAGELNPKHRRGALKGLKDRLREVINEGSYQCHRALTFITEDTSPTFEYVEAGTKKHLTLDRSQIKSYFKISVTFEHFSAISANLKDLVNTGILNKDFKWSWIISLYDLMIFADLIENEADFKEYLNYRIALYDRNDIEFHDEIDILGFYFGGNFPLPEEKENELIMIMSFKDDIETYYNSVEPGADDSKKPRKKQK